MISKLQRNTSTHGTALFLNGLIVSRSCFEETSVPREDDVFRLPLSGQESAKIAVLHPFTDLDVGLPDFKAMAKYMSLMDLKACASFQRPCRNYEFCYL